MYRKCIGIFLFWLSMNDIDHGAFRALFEEACLRCFGHVVTAPLTETESKLLYNKVFEETGLVIGWKTIKNYSFFLLSASPGKQENPSVATLDTLSRYVLGASYTTEPERKKAAGHYPYWYAYREQWVHGRWSHGVGAVAPRGFRLEGDVGGEEMRPLAVDRPAVKRTRGWWLMGIGLAGLVLGIICLSLFFRQGVGRSFRDDFHSLAMDSLAERGWWVTAPDTVYWNKRGDFGSGVALYTLEGDYWPDSVHRPVIRNLLQRRIPCDCFTMEWHLNQFIPRQNWQQAGILLSEDTGFMGKSIRVSIAYNDYNGIYPRSGTILLQAITSSSTRKPEEIAHVPLFTADSLRSNPALARNLEHSALRIEKRGDRFRILYADGILENTSFREITVHEFSMQPRYVGLFALRGFVDSAEAVPARFTWFSLDCVECK